jgi:hypothetical protein
MRIAAKILRTLLAPWETPPPSVSAAGIVEKIQQTLLGRRRETGAHKCISDALAPANTQSHKDGRP